MHNEVSAINMERGIHIKRLDNGGFLLTISVKKKKYKENEYPYEDKIYGYENKAGLLKALMKDFLGDGSSEVDELSSK